MHELPGDDVRGQAVRICSTAFPDDPMFGQAIPQVARRMALLPLIFDLVARDCVKDGWIDLAERDGHAVGTALWSDGGSATSLRGLLSPEAGRIAALSGLRGSLRLLSLQRELDELHKQVITEPHRYLAMLAVQPTHQGGGVAAELLQRGLARADEDGLPVYLETNLPRNVEIYRHKGFVVVRRVEHHGFTTWAMLRPVG